MVSPAFIKQA